MASSLSLDSGAVWFAAFLAVTAALAFYTNSLFEGSAAALLLVGLLFVAYNIFSD